MGSMTDPYIPLEEEIGNVRKALALADQNGFGLTLITKSDRVLSLSCTIPPSSQSWWNNFISSRFLGLFTKSDRVLRDLDLLRAIQEKTKCVVQMTLTTYNEGLCKKLEPNVSTTRERFEVLKELHNTGIPTVVWVLT